MCLTYQHYRFPVEICDIFFDYLTIFRSYSVVYVVILTELNGEVKDA